MKLTNPVCIPDNIIFEYHSFKKRPGRSGYMKPVKANGLKGAVVYVKSTATPDQKRRLVVHEALHIAYPDLTEKQVIKGSRIIAKTLKLARFNLVNKK